ncbi:MAG: hypothetical protein HFJ50_09035 [Clostridia bacterium]|nr:hypothetical protein [Clostridia bacterium]
MENASKAIIIAGRNINSNNHNIYILLCFYKCKPNSRSNRRRYCFKRTRRL